jgi:hypothetical protein
MDCRSTTRSFSSFRSASTPINLYLLGREIDPPRSPQILEELGALAERNASLKREGQIAEMDLDRLVATLKPTIRNDLDALGRVPTLGLPSQQHTNDAHSHAAPPCYSSQQQRSIAR